MATKLMAGNPGLTQLHIEELRRQLDIEEAKLAAMQRPEEPVGENRVIRFAKYGGTYCFAAIKTYRAVPGEYLWYITQDGSRTSRQGHAPKTWDALLAWIGERNWSKIEVLS